jgi:hypothetical protein
VNSLYEKILVTYFTEPEKHISRIMRINCKTNHVLFHSDDYGIVHSHCNSDSPSNQLHATSIWLYHGKYCLSLYPLCSVLTSSGSHDIANKRCSFAVIYNLCECIQS